MKDSKKLALKLKEEVEVTKSSREDVYYADVGDNAYVARRIHNKEVGFIKWDVKDAGSLEDVSDERHDEVVAIVKDESNDFETDGERGRLAEIFRRVNNG